MERRNTKTFVQEGGIIFHFVISKFYRSQSVVPGFQSEYS